MRLAGAAFLGGNENYAVGSTHTVDSGGSILKGRNTLDLVGVQTLHIVARHTVNDNQRRTHTTDVDGRGERTRLTGMLDDLDSSHLSCKRVNHILTPRLLNGF